MMRKKLVPEVPKKLSDLALLGVYLTTKVVATGGLYFLLRHEVRKLEKARTQA